MMEHARRLYLVDDFDRVYKQLQRPSAAVAKTHSSIQLSKTLDNHTLSEDEKVRRYVGELHRYLNIKDARSQQLQQQWRTKRKRSPANINTESLPRAVLQTPPSPPQRRQLRSDTALLVPPHQQPLPDDSDDDVFASPTRAQTTTTVPSTGRKKTPKVRSTKPKNVQAKKKRRIQWIKF